MMCYIIISLMLNIIMFVKIRKHLLMLLLSLEFMIISMFMMLFMNLMYSNSLYFCMIYMVMSVCEGVLGLSLLVSMIRLYGNDYFQSFNILW